MTCFQVQRHQKKILLSDWSSALYVVLIGGNCLPFTNNLKPILDILNGRDNSFIRISIMQYFQPSKMKIGLEIFHLEIHSKGYNSKPQDSQSDSKS